MKWASEDVIVQVIKNTYDFVDRYIDRDLTKEHIGYIVDRVGYQTFKKEVLMNVELNKEIQIAENIQWDGYEYKTDIQFR